MKKLATILALLSVANLLAFYPTPDRTWVAAHFMPWHHTWTCRQGGPGCTDTGGTTVRTCTTTGTTCNITVVTTNAHAVEVMCVNIQSTTTGTAVIPTTDGTWVVATASKAVDTGFSGVSECVYNLNATGGVTTISPKISASLTFDAEFFEFTGTGSGFTLGAAAVGAMDAACTTTCAGVAESGLVTTANNYILVQAAITEATVTALGGCSGACNYNIAANATTGNGSAYRINTSSAAGTPNWTNNASGRLMSGGVGIYEVVSSTFRTQVGGFLVGP